MELIFLHPGVTSYMHRIKHHSIVREDGCSGDLEWCRSQTGIKEQDIGWNNLSDCGYFTTNNTRQDKPRGFDDQATLLGAMDL